MSAFLWNRSVNHLEPRPRQGTPSPTPIDLTKVSEAAHENSRPRARTNCEPTIGLFPLLFDLSQDGSRVTARCLPTAERGGRLLGTLARRRSQRKLEAVGGAVAPGGIDCPGVGDIERRLASEAVQ